jgi:hypothetical protein
MIRLGSQVFVIIATLMLGLAAPPALAAEDVPQRRDAPTLDALLEGLKVEADRAMDAAIAAGERGNHTLKGLKDHWATKVDGMRAALSSQQSNWESFQRDAEVALDDWRVKAARLVEEMHRSALAALSKLGSGDRTESKSTCPEIHV